jgi:aminocarboxymuconate-semialdehyde decarboxylase
VDQVIDLHTHVVPLSTPFLDRPATGNVFAYAVGGLTAATYPHPISVNGVLFSSATGDGRLIACGVLYRYPGLPIMADHGGRTLLTELPRMEFLPDTSDARRELMPETVAACARRLSFDPLLFDAGLLTALVDVVAPTP